MAGSAETVNRIQAEEKTTQGLQYRNGNRNLKWVHIHRRHFESGGEDGISYKKQDHDLEGFLRRDSLAGLSKPGEGHSGHDLSLHDLVTPHGATEGRVANPDGKAVAKAILPSSRGGIDALDAGRRKGNHEGLALGDSTFGLSDGKKRRGKEKKDLLNEL